MPTGEDEERQKFRETVGAMQGSILVHQDSISELAAAMCGEEPEQVYVIEKAGNMPQSSPFNHAQLRLKCLIHQVFLCHLFSCQAKIALVSFKFAPKPSFP